MLMWCLCVDVQNGRGVVGWKAPPKPARETVVRQPTQGQSDAAKRLSQGLSVANVNHSARQRYIAQNHLNLPGALASTGYSVVLDPYEYQPQPVAPQGYIPPSTATGAGQGTGQGQPTASGGAVPAVANLGAPYVPVYGGVFPTFGTDAKPEGLWPSTKANRYISMTSHSAPPAVIYQDPVPICRLLEESRLNRLRLEAAKAHSAGVVRQQVFYFDPNYRDQMSGAGVDGLTLIPPASGGIAQAGGSASTGGLLASDSVYESQHAGGGGTEVDNGRQPLQQPSRFAAHMGTSSGKYTSGAVVSGGSAKVRPAPALQHFRHASTGNMNATVHAAAQAHNAGNSSHSQEELLRQLFPSWF
jgi:hypothetical protein